MLIGGLRGRPGMPQISSRSARCSASPARVFRSASSRCARTCTHRAVDRRLHVGVQRHIFLTPPIIVLFTTRVGVVILIESACRSWTERAAAGSTWGGAVG
jgi:hypothetical protein